jgi:translation elongation factor EF-G
MRTYTELGKTDHEAAVLVDGLPEVKDSPEAYRRQMFEIGRHLADGVLRSLRSSDANICVVCTVEDADFLARGLIQQLEDRGYGNRVRLICLWNEKIKEANVSLSPIVREYKEKLDSKQIDFVIVKSIISGACVVKTNLTKAISIAQPNQIFVAAPVLLIGAEDRLAHEFPVSISNKFEFVHFAVDTEKDGENVIPGIGGSVYELLGLGDSKEKNKYVPKLIKERRAKFFGAPMTAHA